MKSIRDADGRDLLIAELWELGSAGIVELSDTRVRAFFEAGADRTALLARYPGAAVREEENRDWVQEARDLLQPMEVGSRFFLVPEWRDDPTPPGRFRITVNPGLAFGTGVHETTRLCLEALEELVQPGIDVLDVGTGSGILARGGAAAGRDQRVRLRYGPGGRAIAGRRIRRLGGCGGSATVDLVVANISPEAIIALAPESARVLRPGGMLVASGFKGSEVDAVKAALPPATEVRHKNNWSVLMVRIYRSLNGRGSDLG